MKNKEKYNLAHLHIVERPGKTRLDYCFKYVEIEYGGKIVKEYSCLDVEVSKKFFEWLEEDDEKECKTTILTEKEKATPKKPKNWKAERRPNGKVEFNCPVCNRLYTERVNFCANCGQALDWSL